MEQSLAIHVDPSLEELQRESVPLNAGKGDPAWCITLSRLNVLGAGTRSASGKKSRVLTTKFFALNLFFLYRIFSTLSSILDSQQSGKSSKFQLAR